MFQIKLVEKAKNLFSITFFFSKIVPFTRQCEKKYDRVGQATEDNKIRSQKDTICMLGKYGKNTDTRSWHLLLIAFPWQKWLCESASMLRYTYIALLFYQKSDMGWSGIEPEPRDKSDCLYQDLTNRLYETASVLEIWGPLNPEMSVFQEIRLFITLFTTVRHTYEPVPFF
jgi:hypothetical protein